MLQVSSLNFVLSFFLLWLNNDSDSGVGVPKPKYNLHFFDLWPCTVEKLAFLLGILCFSIEINSFSLFLNSYLFI